MCTIFLALIPNFWNGDILERVWVYRKPFTIETNASEVIFYNGKFKPIQIETKDQLSPSNQETTKKGPLQEIFDEVAK